MSEIRDHELDLSDHVSTNEDKPGEDKWDEPSLPPDDFADAGALSEIDESDEEEDGIEPKKSKTGLMIFALIGLIALGGAGFAYMHFSKLESEAGVVQPTQPISGNTAQAESVQAPVQQSVTPTVETPSSVAPAPALPTITDPALAPTMPQQQTLVQSEPPTSVVDVAPTSNVRNSSSSLPTVPEAKNPEALTDLSSGSNTQTAALPVTDKPTEKNIATATTVTEMPAPSGAAANTAQPTPDLAASVSVEAGAGALQQQSQLQSPEAQDAKISAAEPRSLQAQLTEEKNPQNTESAVPVKIAEPAAADKSLELNKIKPLPRTKGYMKHSAHDGEKKSAKKNTVKAAVKPAEPNAYSYTIRSAMPGEAWLVSAQNPSELKHVTVGDILPGLGKIKSITEKSGNWVVIGAKRSIY